MSNFINTIDELGDEVVINSIIDKSILTVTEFRDNKLTEIGYGAFYDCAGLEYVELPNITYFSRYAFGKCTSLKKAKLESAKYLDWTVFDCCTSLTEIYIPNAQTIGCICFQNTAIEKLVLPSVTLVSQSNYPTGFGKMPELKTLDIYQKCTHYSGAIGDIYPKLKDLILRTESGVCIFCKAYDVYPNDWSNSLIGKGEGYIYVPSSMIDTYKSHECWSALADQFRALEDYTVDGTTTGELDESKI